MNTAEIIDKYYQLLSVARYDMIASKEVYTIIKITKCTNKFDYLMNFDSQASMTIESMEGDNKILVTKSLSSSSY